ncbi:MAG: DUF58 domain-containing protein [Anaerolineales bacterium]|nr:DUF58 domain-containing protein [Anaerolineales bacterium]
MGNFTGFIIILLIFAFLLRVDFIFYIIYVCIGVYGWSRWYTPRILKNLAIKRQFADHAFLGETVEVTLEVKNDNRLPVPWLEMSESMAVELAMGQTMNHVTALRTGETATFHYQVRGMRRGYYRLGPLRLNTGDLFGLIDEQNAYFRPDYLTVYPKITPLHRLGLSSRLPFGTVSSHQRLFEDPARPIGVRDFRSGDSLRQINWKVSAHTRNLVVKTLQPAISLETAICLNLYDKDYEHVFRHSTVEWAIEVAASMAAHLTSQRQPVGFFTNGIDPLQGHTEELQFDESSGRLLRLAESYAPAYPIPPRGGRAHLMKILERLARIESADTVKFEQWLPTAAVPLSWGVTIIIITPAADEVTCQALHQLVRKGLNPVLLVVRKNANFSQLKERGRRLGFNVYEVAEKRDFVTQLAQR